MSGLAIRELLASRRARLIAALGVATIAISVLTVQAAGSSLSYYVTPEEFASEIDPEGGRWRVGGRIVEGSVVERNGRPISWLIEGEQGEQMEVAYDGVVPGLFAPRAFVVVEGVAEEAGLLRASSVIIRHEPEFVTDVEDASIAAP
ncbi:MAG: cytochrome c maturation protein CcmE [Chloroflexi bacterium]|nr:cytochrome c maturation protein CcmE [Chloroflexota bacterium]MQC28199.1 cytochrome c maturation protein CcmE [Chloroflexota bacterium]